MANFSDEAHQAWKRLRAWQPDKPSTGPRHAALGALVDIGTVRRLLDQTEVAAVRAARAAGESWSEVAARVGISRQSAWERWRDLDSLTQAPRPADEPDEEPPAAVLEAVAEERAQRLRRRRQVEVPDVVGLIVPDALMILTRSGLEAVSATPDVPLLGAAGAMRSATVVRQYPDSGTRVAGASTVRLWLERGDGSAGVREPRRPVPPQRTARAVRGDDLDEAILGQPH